MVGGVTSATGLPAWIAGTLTVMAVVTAGRSLRGGVRQLAPWLVLAGTACILGHVALATDSPGTLAGFLLGTAGATGAYAGSVVVLRDRRQRLACQALVVGSLVWILGTLAVSHTVAPGTRQTTLGLVGGSIVLAGTAVLARRDETRRLEMTAGLLLAAVFLVPSLAGVLFGEEVLFLTVVIGVGLLVIGWYIDRLR